MTISYNPSTDELFVKMDVLRRKPSKIINGFKLWWNERGRICGIVIEGFIEERKMFKSYVSTIRLGGIWKDVKIDDEDIQNIRKSLLKTLEEKW